MLQLRPLGCNLLPIETDEHGMKPDSLASALSTWTPADAVDKDSDIPRVLYTVPNGVNPTGASLTLERKKKIFQVTPVLFVYCTCNMFHFIAADVTQLATCT